MSDDYTKLDGIIGRFLRAQTKFVQEINTEIRARDAEIKAAQLEIERLQAKADYKLVAR